MITPDWQVPEHIYTAVTVQSKPEVLPVLPGQLCLLRQVHGGDIHVWDGVLSERPAADGAVTVKPGLVIGVYTADCLPILLCDQQGKQIAAIHAGWRGLAGGVIANALRHFARPDQVSAWIGPGISQQHYEIGPEVHEALLGQGLSVDAFSPSERPGHFLADLKVIAVAQLRQAGVGSVIVSPHCTYADRRLCSYRRDGGNAGRLLTLIGITR